MKELAGVSRCGASTRVAAAVVAEPPFRPLPARGYVPRATHDLALQEHRSLAQARPPGRRVHGQRVRARPGGVVGWAASADSVPRRTGRTDRPGWRDAYRQGSAGVKWHIFTLGGERSRETTATQTLKLRLAPVLYDEHGQQLPDEDQLVSGRDEEPSGEPDEPRHEPE